MSTRSTRDSGWIGRNTCLINPDLGSFLFLSEIICTLALEPDRPGLDQCGSCRLCLDACPTGALVASHVLDSTRCLSYLTIEMRGPIPVLNRDALGAHAYGCDICQEVCPWNLQAADESATDPAWLPRAVFDGRSLADLWRTSDADLRRGLKKSAMMRAGLKRLRRNVAVCVGRNRRRGRAGRPCRVSRAFVRRSPGGGARHLGARATRTSPRG